MTWTRDELRRIGDATELQIASRRADGTLRPYVTIWTIWTVGSDGGIYVRTAYGTDNPWFRRALASGAGRIRAGGVEKDVTFEHVPADDPLQSALDAAYHAKYDRFGPQIVGTVVGPVAHRGTIRVH
jgi:hypothetical protein